MASLAPTPHVEAVGSDLFRVPSSDGRTRYAVAHRGDGTFDCTCPAGKRGIPCKHVRAVIEFAARVVAREPADACPERSLPCACGAGEDRAHDPACPALTAPADVFECRCGVAFERPGHVVDGEAWCSERCYDKTAEAMWTGR